MATSNSQRDRVDTMLAFLATFEPERDASAKAIAWRLRRAARQLDTEVRRRLAPLGMELWELEILSGLRRAGSTLTVGELLDVAQLTSGAITNRIARLERNGYVRRDVDPDDRRQVLVTLTPSGLERQLQAVEANDVAEQEIFATIDTALQRRLGQDLRELLLAIEGPDPRA